MRCVTVRELRLPVGRSVNSHYRARVATLLVVWLVSALPNAAVAGSPAARLKACAAEKDDALRLACFDREVATLSGTDAPDAPTAVTEMSPEERFGARGAIVRDLESERQRYSPDLKSLESTVKRLEQHATGVMVITLENDQVWMQREANVSVPLRVGDKVMIRAASLGSYLLRNPTGRTVRVSRVK
jgi:hypothetical protein